MASPDEIVSTYLENDEGTNNERPYKGKKERRRGNGATGIMFGTILGILIWTAGIVAFMSWRSWNTHQAMVEAYEARIALSLESTCVELIQYGLKMDQAECLEFFQMRAGS